jgi:uncharacterized protein with FMN-binding domain
MSRYPESPPEDPQGAAPKRPVAPTGTPKRKPDGGKKFANGIVALSSAAILTVYAVGYVHTTAAAANAAPTAVIASVATTPIATAASLLTPTAVPTSVATATTATTAPATSTTAPAATTQPTAALAASATYKDGTYTGSGTSRHGGVTVAVTIKNGVITSAAITASNTRYPISRIAALPGEVVAAQSASIDFVSGATDSSMAFHTAVASALALAKGA